MVNPTAISSATAVTIAFSAMLSPTSGGERAFAIHGEESSSSHPLHTSLAELSLSPDGGVTVSIRVFADDYTAAADRHKKAAAARRSPARAGISPLVAYALASFSLIDRGGRLIPLEWCGGRQAGDLIWLCLRGRVASAPSGLRVSSRILCDVFDDQINIVQAAYGGRKVSLLFTPGDEAKQLP